MFSKNHKLKIEAYYKQAEGQLAKIKQQIKRPLTLSEKILFSHLCQQWRDKDPYLNLSPNRVILQDVTAQMALLQFMLTGKNTTSCPTSIHCDHLILAKEGVDTDLKNSLMSNKEVFDFLHSSAQKYGIDFWRPGSGIIHQVVLENYAFPGALIIGTDSHTPNAGGLGALAIGVGGADAVDVMAGFPWELKRPKITGVHLTGALTGWASPKDVILKLLGILTVKGGTDKIIEYFGEGTQHISCTGKATITNMGAELGATTSVFPYDLKMEAYLKATFREELAQLAGQYKNHLQADKEVLQEPEKYYDELIEIDLSSLEPHISGPHSPDRVRPLKDFKKEIQKEGWPVKLSSALIGSCTNSSYEDIGLAAHVARQAQQKGIKMPQPFLVTPGSDLVKKTIERDGYMQEFQQVGAVVLANACGPCIGQWQRNIKKGEVNTILNSFNRNFKGRNDANPNTLSFIASPEVVTAIGLSGRLDFNPQTDELIQGEKSLSKKGDKHSEKSSPKKSDKQSEKRIRFQAPTALELPQKPFVKENSGFIPPTQPNSEVKILQNSQRLQALSAFKAWDGKDFIDLLILCNAKGKCTTDHISPAGFWLKYRGHLDKISDNLLLGAVNNFNGETGRGKNILTNTVTAFSQIARDYKSKGRPWMIIGEENYGEGSSREHAAMSPRYLGAKVVLVKSFARIHETNLKKQGILPLTFVNPLDKTKFKAQDRVSLLGLKHLKPSSQHPLVIKHQDGSKEEITVKHSLNIEQIKWFKAGSSLNTLR